MAKPLRVGIDLDGCAYDFSGAFKNWLMDIGYPGAAELPAPDRWETWECWDMDEQQWLDLFRKGVAAGVIFSDGAPEQGFAQAIAELRSAGHTIHVVTHRTIHAQAIPSTAQWLDTWRVQYDSLTFAKDKRTVPTDIFIEDNVDNATALAGAGTQAVLFDQAWNRHCDDPRIDRVYGWTEFVDAVHDLAAVAR